MLGASHQYSSYEWLVLGSHGCVSGTGEGEISCRGLTMKLCWACIQTKQSAPPYCCRQAGVVGALLRSRRASPRVDHADGDRASPSRTMPTRSTPPRSSPRWAWGSTTEWIRPIGVRSGRRRRADGSGRGSTRPAGLGRPRRDRPSPAAPNRGATTRDTLPHTTGETSDGLPSSATAFAGDGSRAADGPVPETSPSASDVDLHPRPPRSAAHQHFGRERGTAAPCG